MVRTHFSPTQSINSLRRAGFIDIKSYSTGITQAVIPAKAGIQVSNFLQINVYSLDSRFRGNDGSLFVSVNLFLFLDDGLRGGKPGDGNAEGTGRHIGELGAVTELDGFRIASVFAANTHF